MTFSGKPCVVNTLLHNWFSVALIMQIRYPELNYHMYCNWKVRRKVSWWLEYTTFRKRKKKSQYWTHNSWSQLFLWPEFWSYIVSKNSGIIWMSGHILEEKWENPKQRPLQFNNVRTILDVKAAGHWIFQDFFGQLTSANFECTSWRILMPSTVFARMAKDLKVKLVGISSTTDNELKKTVYFS